MAAEGRRRLRLSSVRGRTTAGAVAVVGVALAIGALGLLALLRSSLTRAVDTSARTRVEVIAGLARQGKLPAVLPVAGEENTLVQVIDARGRVVASSPNLEGESPIATFAPSGSSIELHSVRNLPIGDNETTTFRVAAERVTTNQGLLIVYAAASLSGVQGTISTLGALLAVGLPMLLVLVGGTTALVVRRALRPVESIRAEVADISGRDLHRRVPEPGTDDEIGRLARTMNAMLDRLESFSRRQQEFVADASHELQSPLAAGRAELEVALHHPETADWPSVARETLEEHERMERLVWNLLFLARADEGGIPVSNDVVDLDEVVRSEAGRLADRARVAIDMSGVESAEVRGNADQLAQVVRNLLENANRHAAARVVVRLSDREGAAELVVADDGPGVPAADRDRIFERFTRSDSSRHRVTGGSGLGLAITRRIVEAHGGTIFVEDGTNGARFITRLPRAPSAHRSGMM